MLAPDTAQNLGLAFHELATNASKYGALAAEHGRARRHLDAGRTGEVRILWRERGGPPVSPPERRGFGRVLLERLVGATLNGSVTLDFRPEGLVCEIEFPEDGLAADRERPMPAAKSGHSARRVERPVDLLHAPRRAARSSVGHARRAGSARARSAGR